MCKNSPSPFGGFHTSDPLIHSFIIVNLLHALVKAVIKGITAEETTNQPWTLFIYSLRHHFLIMTDDYSLFSNMESII